MKGKQTNKARLYPAQIHSVTDALTEIFLHSRFSDKVVEHVLASNPKAGAKDRAFIAETVYNLVRFWRLYWAVLDKEPQFRKIDLWQLFGVYWLMNGEDLPPFSEFKGLAEIPLQANYDKAMTNPAFRLSVSDELYALMEDSQKELEAMNRPADVHLRANPLKMSVAELEQQLAKEGIQCEKSPLSSEALILKNRKNFLNNELFRRGCFEVQDSGSQAISLFLSPQPGARVIDACAGAGGKSLHMAALMQNKGKIISMDVEQRKLDELQRRARRGGVTCIETRLIEGSKSIKRLHATADYLLLDVPCTGSGVLRRNPDAKYRIDRTMLEKVSEIQRQILDSYPFMLKPGAVMVYATCSLIPIENEEQIKRFMEQHSADFELEQQTTLYPSAQNSDGFFMARLKKKA